MLVRKQKLDPSHIAEECKMMHSVWKKVYQFLIKLNMHLRYKLAMVHLGI
jgi:hypothetical protein